MTIVKLYWSIYVTYIETYASIWNVNNCVTFHELITGNITMHSIVFFILKVRFTHAFGQLTLEASSNWKFKSILEK